MEVAIPFFNVNQKNRPFILTIMKLGILAKISYAAIRGQSAEAGAVQRVLNQQRIVSIKNFTLSGGSYPGAVVLNWVNTENPLQREGSIIKFRNEEFSAQLIDGQHRIAGIKEAIEEDPSLEEYEIPVSIYENMSTRDCADIFLSINTEQRTVPKSLVFDLYGIASEPLIDPAAVRARDIANALNEREGSPYFENIKLPGAPKRKGGIALSTAVSSLKPLLEDKGTFEQVGIESLEMQTQIIINYFTALKSKYGDKWESNQNVFQYAAGFVGAIDFLKNRLVTYCMSMKSFKAEIIAQSINLNPSNLLMQDEVKGLGGKDAPKVIFDRLVDSFNVSGSSAEISV
jgi:DGQHR domain-containing protein